MMTSLVGCKRNKKSAPDPAQAKGSAAPARRPRYVVQIVLGGGIDPILTTDPRTPDQIADGIDLPYGPERVVELGNGLVGPEFAPFSQLQLPIAIVNGVALNTANHHTGFEQIVRLRTRVDQRLPSLGDIIGLHRPDIPVGAIALGSLQRHDYSPGWLNGTELFDEIGRMDGKDVAMLGEVMTAQAKTLAGDRREAAIATAQNVDRVGRLLTRIPTLAPPRFGSLPGNTPAAHMFERTLWALENDLAASLYVKVAKFDWDTHNHNLRRQIDTMRRFLPDLLGFLAALTSVENDRGKLIDQTLVVISSEIGRFPRLNGAEGKDHFPEAPFIFAGAGIAAPSRCEVYGATGKEMEGHPIDPKTGRRLDGGHSIMLDDIGATVLTLAGIDQQAFGYRGRPLPFLMAEPV